MARVSKDKLSNDLLHNLFKQLSQSLSKLPVEKINTQLYELLGPEERIVIAKRLAAIIMLHEGHTLYRVAKTLKISTATAKKLYCGLQQKSYDNLISSLKKKKRQYGSILNLIDSMLTFGGIMPYYGQQSKMLRKVL
ncbi:MAG TPA: Trp family transcriptional regulator [Candidatus Paceibacterota bacterium]|nr:Trp family transcriptional regulator [Candidatus Paceibacterota bacterium]HMO82786.1 Trp family transcriptional regulator [Candidatus Paceibacterota bacterium]